MWFYYLGTDSYKKKPQKMKEEWVTVTSVHQNCQSLWLAKMCRKNWTTNAKKTYSNTKNNILVPVIRNTVRKNIPVFGADIKYPSQ